jgi:NAD(P)-dependent dehydrogenase (short-subunit alcohol dehydrogenase family)
LAGHNANVLDNITYRRDRMSGQDLHQRTVLVTGGARGIGRAIASAAAAAGARVIVVDIDRVGAEETARSIAHTGASALAFTCDIASDMARGALLRAVASSPFGWPDILVNNAGVQIVATALALDDEAWQHTLAVNLEAPFRLTQSLAREWISRAAAGAVVNIASIAGYVHFPLHAAYSTSKAGLRALTGALALELAPHRIRVNAVAPGHVNTAMSLVARDAEALAERLREIPLARLATPEDIASVVVYLASSRAAYITGQTVTVDGGYTLQ